LGAMKVTGRNLNRGTIDRPALVFGLSWSIAAETRKMVIYA